MSKKTSCTTKWSDFTMDALEQCRECVESTFPGVCCKQGESACDGEYFYHLLAGVKQGLLKGNNYSAIQYGEYQGLLDPCLNCNFYIDNPRATEPNCVGIAGGKKI